ncbi:MAG: hypothetical protein JNJ42_08715 [Burkholderiaceae bacterium]|nr:hypothetical protein [Burkholderiaceae bacterium]
MPEPDKPTPPAAPEPAVPPVGTAAAMPVSPPEPDPVALAQRRARWAQIAGPGQLHAAVLALLLSPGRKRERSVWKQECDTTPGAKAIRDEALAIDPRERLPWIEFFSRRVAQGPMEQRQQLLRAARRLMAADGRTDALDRLRWLAIRHALGDDRALALPAAADVDLEGLATETARRIGQFSAFLSRLVPSPEIDLDVISGVQASGERWWAEVMQPWPDVGATRELPDIDALVTALRDVQSLPWMLRPVLVRRWVDAAVALSPGGQLGEVAAEALRIAARLLDCPLPPALAVRFVECEAG